MSLAGSTSRAMNAAAAAAVTAGITTIVAAGNEGVSSWVDIHRNFPHSRTTNHEL